MPKAPYNIVSVAESGTHAADSGVSQAIRSSTLRDFLMFRLSAFADEIDPDPQRQVDVLKQCGIRHIELRSILKTNVLDLSDLQVQELKALLDKSGITLSALGSPIGKIKIDEPFPPHLQ